MGPKYGTILKNNDTVGVMFDTIEVELLLRARLASQLTENSTEWPIKTHSFANPPSTPQSLSFTKTTPFD